MFYWWIALTTLVVVFVGVTAFKYFVEAPLVNMTRENFEDGPYKFLMFGVDWCPHCVKAKPEFAALGSTKTIGGSTVEMVAINPEEEENPYKEKVKISGYPTLALLSPNGSVTEYDGPRNTASMDNFLTSNCS
jgi:thiol-disulfide isomerase/thioredoxin